MEFIYRNPVPHVVRPNQYRPNRLVSFFQIPLAGCMVQHFGDTERFIFVGPFQFYDIQGGFRFTYAVRTIAVQGAFFMFYEKGILIGNNCCTYPSGPVPYG